MLKTTRTSWWQRLTKFWSEIQNGGVLAAVLNDGIHCSYGLHVCFFFISEIYIRYSPSHVYTLSIRKASLSRLCLQSTNRHIVISEISFFSHIHAINRESFGKFIGYNCFLFLSLKYSQFSHLHVVYRWWALLRFGPVRRLRTQIMARSTDRHLEITEVLVILTNTCTRYLFGVMRGLLKMAKSADQYLERRFLSS